MSEPVVTVASKFSFPLILSVTQGHWEEYTDPNGRQSRSFVPGETVSYTVAGFGSQRRLENNGQATGESGRVVGNYGLTTVPEDFWNAWLAENDRPGSSFHTMIRKGLIFAHSRPSYVAGQAKEQAATKSGTEALIPQTFDRTGHRTSEIDERIAPQVSTLDRDP